MTLREQAKAVVGGVLAGLGSLATAVTDSSVTAPEWVAVAIAAVGAYGLVYRTGQPVRLDQLPALTSDHLLRLAEAAADRERAGREPR